MNQKERIFFRLVCDECIRNKHISESWVKEYANAWSWTYNDLLEYLDKWTRDGIYNYVGKIANGRLLFEKLIGEYKMIYNDVVMEGHNDTRTT